jgi:23S rRNA (uridine2552-2'-O)-methyltransferase
MRGDAAAAEVQDALVRECAGRVDVVLSDMAPKLTGVRARDAAASAALAEAAFALAERVLKPRGRLLVKVFQSPETEAALARMRLQFRTFKLTHSDATRKGSAEHYAVGIDFRAGAPAGD